MSEDMESRDHAPAVTAVTSGQLAALIARVEAATGADRTIDAALMALTYRQEHRNIGGTCYDDSESTCCPGGRHLDLVWVDPVSDQWKTTARDGFDLTASLDAALALVQRVLPGWTVQLFEQDPEFGGGWIARLRRYSPYALTALDGMDPPPATAALALLLALLRALQSSAKPLERA